MPAMSRATQLPRPDDAVTHEGRRLGSGLRMVAVAVLLVITGLIFATYLLVWWSERQVLTSDAWVSYASELPKNPDVTWAVSDKITTQIFATVPVQQKIAEVLPPRAEFLATPLAEQLEERTVNMVENIVGSETFQGVWTGANKLAIDRILTRARDDSPASGPLDNFALNLDGMKPMLRDRVELGSPIAPVLRDGDSRLFEIVTSLRTVRERIRDVVQTTDFLYITLPAAFTAAFFGVMTLATDRRRALLQMSIFTLCVLLLELIAIKYGRQQLLSRVENAQYIPAVSYIYDSLFATLRTLIFYGLGFWSVVVVLAVTASSAAWAVRVRKLLHIYDLSSNRVVVWFRKLRVHIARYRYAIWLGIVLLGLLFLAFVSSVSTATTATTLLIMLGLILFVQMLADPHIQLVTTVTAPHPRRA